MSKIKFIIIGVSIPIILGILAFSIIQRSIPEFVWVVENRLLFAEVISPDSTHKIAGYYYDQGALGYTAVQVSVVKVDEDYPIMGNVLKSQNFDHIEWRSSEKAVVYMKDSDGFDAEIAITVKRE